MQRKILLAIVAILIVLGVGWLLCNGGVEEQKENNQDELTTTLDVVIDEEQKKEVEDKIAELKKKIQEDPEIIKYWLDLALYEKSFGDLLRVESVYKEALEKFPNNLTIIANLGDLYKIMGDYSRSEEYYLKAIKMNPVEYYFYRDLAELYLYKIKDKRKTEDIYLKGLSKTQNNAALLKVYAYFLEEEGRISDSIMYWEMLLKEESVNKELIEEHIEELSRKL